MKKISWFDLMIYRLFRWRWNKILRERPALAILLAKNILDWDARRKD